MNAPTEQDHDKAAELVGTQPINHPELQRALAGRIAEALADAREEGRQSVGLGDFLPDPCGEEERAPNYHFVESYGAWLPCTRRRGHDGEHEHEDSGFHWPASSTRTTHTERETP